MGLAERFIRRPPDQRPPVEPWLAAALQHEPDHARAWYATAWLAAQQGDQAAVEQALTDAARAGVRLDDVQQMRALLEREFPAVRNETESQP